LPYLLFEDGSAAPLQEGGNLFVEQSSAIAVLPPAMSRAHYLLLVLPPVLALVPYRPPAPTGWASLGTRRGPDPDAGTGSRRAGLGVD